MCGITGIISLKNEDFDQSLIIKMTDSLAHRGPDGEGYLFTNSPQLREQITAERPSALIFNETNRQFLAFGHRRLSILDLDQGAAQPMTDVSGNYSIVFNGEIYNHAILRKELESEGYKFKTDHSDTEVILNAYARWGIDCVTRFNGMWAFCLWDRQNNSFFICRDRAGKKPFYYTIHNNIFYFASELKAILQVKQIPRQLDEKGLYDYLTFMMVPAPGTIFQNIYKLPAAHFAQFKPGEQIKIKRYWLPFQEQSGVNISEKEATEGIRERIYEAARLRMVADVEVGVLLSGGLDSSINLACLSKYATKPIKAFSVGFENKPGYKNEFEYAEKVARHFKADYHPLTLTEKDFFDFYPDMVYFQDEPIADTANIPIYYIAKAARARNVKVLLGGEGSDELFVGYKLWTLARDFAKVLEGKPKLAQLSETLQRITPLRNRRLFYYPWYKKIKRGQPVFWSGTELRSEEEKQTILQPGFISRLNSYTSFEPVKGLYNQFISANTNEPFNWMTATDLQYRLPDLLLARLDRMLMAASVEGRNPFLDVNVMEYAMSLNPKLKTRNGEEKYILKKAFEGILPHEIIYRPKDSFTVPLKQLFTHNQQFQKTAMGAIEEFNRDSQVFSKNYIGSLIKNNASELWNVSNLALWYNKFKNL